MLLGSQNKSPGPVPVVRYEHQRLCGLAASDSQGRTISTQLRGIADLDVLELGQDHIDTVDAQAEEVLNPVEGVDTSAAPILSRPARARSPRAGRRSKSPAWRSCRARQQLIARQLSGPFLGASPPRQAPRTPARIGGNEDSAGHGHASNNDRGAAQPASFARRLPTGVARHAKVLSTAVARDERV